MPGGVDAYADTIGSALDYVDRESPLETEFKDWILDQGDMKSEESARRRLSFLKQAGLLTQNGNQIRVGERGYGVLGAAEPELKLFELFDEKFIGFSELIELLQQHHTVSEIHKELVVAVGKEDEWNKQHQTTHRLNYLRSLGLVELIDGDEYKLTTKGKSQIGNDTKSSGDVYTEPSSPTSYISQIKHDASTAVTFYWIEESSEDRSNDYVKIRLETGESPSPMDIGSSDVLIHYTENQVIGYSTLREEKSKTTIQGKEYIRAPIYFHRFEAPVPISDLLGQLTSDKVVPGTKLSDDAYPFTRTGLRDISFGVLPGEAARVILETGGDLQTYADLDIELDMSAVELPDKSNIPLHFPDEIFESLLSEIEDALLGNQHFIFIGPPGTGKTKLAQIVASEVNKKAGYTMVTATTDWSTFDTVGGYQPDQDSHLEFMPGVFLSRFQESDSTPTNEWLIVDEINRSNIDKAFGSFFSALSGDDVTTAFKSSDGKEIKILGSGNSGQTIHSNQYYIPETWRLLATMNTHDKMSLYDMSYAFMRRFAFIHVGAPTEEQITSQLIEEYISEWDGLSVRNSDSESDGDSTGSETSSTESYKIETASHEESLELESADIKGLVAFWKSLQPHRTIGPGIIRNLAVSLARQGNAGPDLTSPVKMYALPQLEDLPESTQEQAVNEILTNEKIPLNRGRFRQFVTDYFGIAASHLERE